MLELLSRKKVIYKYIWYFGFIVTAQIRAGSIYMIMLHTTLFID